MLVIGCLVTGVYWKPVVGMRYNVMQIFAAGAVPIIASYNGEKGKQVNKYLFYAVYPVHLLLFGLIHLCMTSFS